MSLMHNATPNQYHEKIEGEGFRREIIFENREMMIVGHYDGPVLMAMAKIFKDDTPAAFSVLPEQRRNKQ